MEEGEIKWFTHGKLNVSGMAIATGDDHTMHARFTPVHYSIHNTKRMEL